jgi:hypothetical protein
MEKVKTDKVKKVKPITHKNVLVNKILNKDLSTIKRSEVRTSFELAVAYLMISKEYDILIKVLETIIKYEVK